MPGPSLPLAGCRVLEHSRTVAAAYAGRLLAAMGATVVMAEPPDGSPLRRAPPLLDRSRQPDAPGQPDRPAQSALFAFLSAGKSSLICDLLSPAGRDVFERELQSTHILIDDTPVR